MLSQEAIEDIASRLIKAAHAPSKLILFGSYARGEATEDSDLDIMLVEKEIPDHTAEYRNIRLAIGKAGIGVDLLLYDERDFEKHRQWCSTPAYWASREGKLLYGSLD
ncbi:nucleotidyltransferase domain-containing protein [Ectothiorhodospira lacustris]|uniref:nucleotidyltransferase domain-containing protein n=1 Tax=Ectothiorhodospira lacustris TaxID=2899127 RepID=UPI001EE826A4|nr:nucleotidyltransferase domain-containing protein [Ectothiorhodospira lacustris]MCG5510362.1 nucleotidyltransferase domain-containing protein [Ectothiorhodospira lacustris]MCG5522108.1 nucleotidyltransferase domain-containing protein [Ectothiorhodospira lacustris]